MERQPLSDTEYRWFADWLRHEYGLHFGPEKRDILRSRLDPCRLALGFDSFEQLLFHLKYHPNREADREKLLPQLTNKESYFFRESAQLDLLREEILAEIARERGPAPAEPVRILSAGCAAGEEPYSLAIIVRQAALFSPVSRVEITGIDLDPDALARAREAVYGENAFRRVDPSARERYFDPVDDRRWKVHDGIREMVHFEQANLADPKWTNRFPKQDVIFCRNVLIYFDEESMRSVIDSFYQLLRPGGVLFLGHAESLSQVPTRFVPVRRPGAIYYRRPRD